MIAYRPHRGPVKPVIRGLISTFLLLGMTALAWGDPGAESGVQVLTRGPVHEAFASASMTGSTAGVVIARAPYEPVTEVPPDLRPEGDDVAWIPGYWCWDDDRSDFIWVSGVWRDLPPGRQWVPGYWASSQGGSQWISGFWGDAVQAEVTYLPAPPEPLEAGPSSPPPGPGTSWAPGCWIWQQTRYDWQPGYWVAPQPQWVWSPAHYTWTPRGYVYVPGYWDHDLGHRGVIFAPVYYERPVYARPNYYYSPAIVIDLAVIAAFMFVQPRSHHYYYGDYYDRRYEERGFYPWHSRDASRYGDDPLYVHYRAEQLLNDRDWDIHVDERYHQRRDHAEFRPPQTLAIQINLINERRSDGPDSLVIGRTITESIESRTRPQRFSPVDADERGRIESRGKDVRKLQVERANLEGSSTTTVRPGGGVPQAEPARVRLPKSPVTARTAENGGRSKTPPPAPAIPRPKASERRVPEGGDKAPAREAAPRPDRAKAPPSLGAPGPQRNKPQAEAKSPEPPKASERRIPEGGDKAPAREAAPRPDRAKAPPSLGAPGPQRDKPQAEGKSPEPPKTRSSTGTVGPRRDSVRPPSSNSDDRPQRQAPKVQSPRPDGKHQQVTPRRSPDGKNITPRRTPGSEVKRSRRHRNNDRKRGHHAARNRAITYPLGRCPNREEFPMHMFKQFILALIVLAVVGVIASGCNTFKGAGKDIQKGGRAVEGAAEDVENNK